MLVYGFGPAYAYSNWTQSDWSGGVGPSVTTQYASATGISVNGSNQVELTESASWPVAYSNWSARTPITITNNVDALTDYQVRIPITYDSAMNNDFSDIRFANSSSVALDYWIETKTDGVDAVVWVKVDSLVATGNTTINMYYGNAGATTASSGEDTFLFFDDFNGTLDMDKWILLGSSASSYFYTSGGELVASGNANWQRGLAATQSFDHDDLALEFKYRWTSNNPSYDAFMFGWRDQTVNGSYQYLPHAYYNSANGGCTTNCSVNIYEDGQSRGTVAGEWSQNVQYLNRVQMKDVGGANYEQSTDLGATWTTSYNSAYSNEDNLRPGFSLHSGTHRMDDLRVRKSTTGGEPTSVVGVKESKYPAIGTLTSNILDATFPADWADLDFVKSGTGTVTLKVRSDNDPNMATATNWATCNGATDGMTLSNNNCVDNEDQYLQYQITLEPIGASTPVFESVDFQYSASDQTPPDTNASAIQMQNQSGGQNVASNGWARGNTPYFSWTAAADNSGGAGIKGYCLYLGQDNSADPITTKGLLGTSPVDTNGQCQFAVPSENVNLALSGYLGSALSSSNSPYYLNIKSIDGANNVFTGSSEQFQFRFDNTPPSNPSFISAPSNFVSSKDVTLTWPTTGPTSVSDNNSGVAGLQYKIGNSGTWYGIGHTGAQDETDLLPNNGSYTTVDPIDYDEIIEGNNIVYFRSYDLAGNPSLAHVSTVIKLNTASPTPPQNVTATPTTNTNNSFAFSWLAPASFQGSAGNMTYCYTINSVPTANSCTFTAPGVTSLPVGAYATQPAENTIYVVAKDEAGNINYATASSTTFTANTSAPGIPLNPEIADISTKSSSSWKLALSWSSPSDVGAGVAKYQVFRSLNNVDFSQVAESGGTSFVDTDLSQVDYFYKVKACDSANNCGALSSVVSELPTGRFTTPAEIITNPSVSVSTRSAKISWATDRTSDSRIQIGVTSNQYLGTEASVSDQVKNHEVDLNNLTAGTTYFYKARWTDEDGNTGTTSELVFKTLPAPTIRDVEIKRISLTSAVLQFVAKDAVKVKIFYGLSDGFGGLEEINSSTQESTYTVELAGLNDGAKYFYKINTIDADGNEYDSGRIDSFTTPARPRISNLRFQPVEGEPTSTQNVTWTTNVPASSLVRYSTADVPAKESVTSKLSTEHSVIMTNLKDDSIYTLVAESRDADGNLAISDSQTFRTELDTRPPKVTKLRIETSIRGVGSESSGQLIVYWKTDEPATSQVSYGQGASGRTYTSTTAEDGKLTTEHTVIIAELSTSEVYHLKAISRDKGENTGRSKDKSAIIGQSSDSVFDIIFGTFEKIFGL